MTDEEKMVVGYQAAIDMINAQSADNWARFNALLVSNSVLLAAVGFVLTEKLRVPVSIWLSTGIGCGFGFLLCVLWWLLILRGDSYIRYWNAVARELENRLHSFNLLRRGQQYGGGGQVVVGMGQGEAFQMHYVASFRSVWWMYSIIWLFAGVYVVVLLFLAFGISRGSSPALEGWSLLMSVLRQMA
jgi:hypothetical protein